MKEEEYKAIEPYPPLLIDFRPVMLVIVRLLHLKILRPAEEEREKVLSIRVF